MSLPGFDRGEVLVAHIKAIAVLKKIGPVTREQLEREIFKLKMKGEDFCEGRVRALYEKLYGKRKTQNEQA